MHGGMADCMGDRAERLKCLIGRGVYGKTAAGTLTAKDKVDQ
jgi:hypothetical protein